MAFSASTGRCSVRRSLQRCVYCRDSYCSNRPIAFGPVTGLGMRAKAPAVGKRDRGRCEVDWSLAVVQLSLGIWDVSRYS